MSCSVVINQSNYLPWKGYFDLIHDADVFIFLDDVQYTKNDWRNRNRFKGPNGTFWLTIPTGGSTSQRITDVRLPRGPWAQKQWRTLSQNYRTTPYFSDYSPFFSHLFESMEWPTLSGFNQHLIKAIARDFLGLETKFLDSSNFGFDDTGQDKVISLIKAVNGTSYISGPAAKAYLDPAAFKAAGIELIWKDYSGYPEYQQPFPPFEHAVSIVDLLFCTGPHAPEHIWGWRPTT